jgi:NCS1 family nucleobase:cation symporter-1
VSGIFVYTVFSKIFPSKEALIPRSIYSLEVVEGKEMGSDRDVEGENRGVFEKKGGNVDAVDFGKAF